MAVSNTRKRRHNMTTPEILSKKMNRSTVTGQKKPSILMMAGQSHHGQELSGGG